MKKYRCPHCGAKTFDSYPYNAHKYWRTNKRVVERDNGENRFLLWAMTCDKCEKSSRFSQNDPQNMLLFVAVAGATVIALAAIVGFVTKSREIALAIAAILSFACALLYKFIKNKDKELMPCDSDTHNILYLEPDVKVTVNFPKYIKPYGVYGLKFKTETDDEKFKQAFSDGMVPAVFHPNQKGSLTYDVRIINKSAVPKELLETGSKFLVEDADGIFIAKGTIEKSELDY